MKKLKDMTKMVTSILGMAGNPTATLLMALVIITIKVCVVQGNAYLIFMLNQPMVCPITLEPPCIYFYGYSTHGRSFLSTFGASI
jgi:hypothetical protein